MRNRNRNRLEETIAKLVSTFMHTSTQGNTVNLRAIQSGWVAQRKTKLSRGAGRRGGWRNDDADDGILSHGAFKHPKQHILATNGISSPLATTARGNPPPGERTRLVSRFHLLKQMTAAPGSIRVSDSPLNQTRRLGNGIRTALNQFSWLRVDQQWIVKYAPLIGHTVLEGALDVASAKRPRTRGKSLNSSKQTQTRSRRLVSSSSFDLRPSRIHTGQNSGLCARLIP